LGISGGNTSFEGTLVAGGVGTVVVGTFVAGVLVFGVGALYVVGVYTVVGVPCTGVGLE
jgi:hypothetical protein